MPDIREVGDEWPEGVSDGLRLYCSGCGRRPLVDYTVTDDEWERVVPINPTDHSPNPRRGVLCLRCFVRHGGDLSKVLRVQVVGNGETLVLDPATLWRYPRTEHYEP